jgi:hypothetical protein
MLKFRRKESDQTFTRTVVKITCPVRCSMPKNQRFAQHQNKMTSQFFEATFTEVLRSSAGACSFLFTNEAAQKRKLWNQWFVMMRCEWFESFWLGIVFLLIESRKKQQSQNKHLDIKIDEEDDVWNCCKCTGVNRAQSLSNHFLISHHLAKCVFKNTVISQNEILHRWSSLKAQTKCHRKCQQKMLNH